MSQFSASRQESIARIIDASPVATAVIERCEAGRQVGASMSVKALLDQVE